MKNHWLQDLGHFLAEQRQVAYLFLAGVGLFALVFFLYSLPMEPLLYAFFLYLLFCIILEGVWFVRWRTRHKARQTILQNLPLLTSSLPDAKTQGEADLNTMGFSSPMSWKPSAPNSLPVNKKCWTITPPGYIKSKPPFQ